MTLTEQRIRDMRPGSRTEIQWDNRVTGLGVRITPKGAKAYILNYYRADGTERRMTLGKVGEFSLSQASVKTYVERSRNCDV